MPDEIGFGLAEYKGKITGIQLTSVKKDQQSATAEAVDEEGYINQINRHSFKDMIALDGNVKGDISALVVGGKVTVDGAEYGIDSVSVTKTNTGHHTVSISGSKPREKPVVSPASSQTQTPVESPA